jgi:hypothetical protein
MYSTSDIFGLHGRFEGGAQYVSKSGFRTDLGFALIAFKDAEGKQRMIGWPVIHLGWVW